MVQPTETFGESKGRDFSESTFSIEKRWIYLCKCFVTWQEKNDREHDVLLTFLLKTTTFWNLYTPRKGLPSCH